VLSQTCTDFNIIILDSGSTDGTVHWLQSLNDERICIHTTDKRLGIAENWGRITAIDKNEFITILGHDDILFPNYLSSIELLRKKYPDAGLYLTHFNLIDGSGNIIRPCKRMKEKYDPLDFLSTVLENAVDITATGFVMPSKLYDECGGIPPYDQLLYADIELWLKMIQDSCLAVSPDECFSFRFHSDNTSKTFDRARLVGFERLCYFLADFVKDKPAYTEALKKYAPSFLKNYTAGTCNKLLYILEKNRDGITMAQVTDTAKKSAKLLLPEDDFKPEKFTEVRIAKLIDSIPVLRKLFLYYKSFSQRTY
jgi:glycosyltransferase involved in cell wall biosynthesis